MTEPEKPTLASRLRVQIPEIVDVVSKDAHETALVPRALWLEAASALQDHGFRRFIDLTVVDLVDEEQRFEVHLLVYSMTEKRWVRLKTRTDEKLSSVYSVFKGVHNYEREAFDLFGVVFDGHPKLTRILLPDAWQGHPLRRDDPLVVEPVDFTITRDLYNT